MTQGRAIFTMVFDHYEGAPKSVVDDVVEKSGKAAIAA
jgi:translation elongation factor EF-G